MPPKFKISRGGARGGRGGRGGGFGAYRPPSYSDKTSSSGSASTAATGRSLIIVESPAKCQKIESYLGKDKYMCLASFGHIREIEDGLKSIDIDHEFKTKFAVMSSKQGQVAKLRAAIANATEVILATDDDREGEAIAWHLCQVFNLSVETTKRIIFHEITEPAIKAAVAAPRTIDMSLVHAQQARQILDLVVGYKISPVLWTYVAHTNLSAGRCQTPALRLIYDNYKDIEGAGGATMVYSVSGIFTKLNLTFHLSRDLESTETLERFIQETAVAPDTAFRAKVSASKKVTKAPPRPYSTSTLQQAASNDLHLSPKDTMFAAQKLYEGGYITYMRTDSKVYSAEFVTKACGYIRGRWGGAGTGAGDDLIGNIGSVTGGGTGAPAGGTEAAHEAIRPTDISRTLLPQSCHPREHRLYSIILRNTLESLMAPAICQTITMAIPSPVPVEGPGDASTAAAEYRHTAEQVIKPGWKLVAGYEADAAEYTYFASLATAATATAQPMPYKKIMTKCSMRNTKSHHTESGLVQLLEKMGIGRPSTFSSLIDKIQERGYVKLQDVRGKSLECIEYTIIDAAVVGGIIDASLNSPSKKGSRKIESKTEVREIGGETRKLVIQPLGIIVIEFLLEHFAPLFEYEFTKNMETQLDEIATDGMVWHELCYKCWFDVTAQLQELKERGVVKEEIKIDDRHSYILSKNGPVIRCRVADAADDDEDDDEDEDDDDEDDDDDDDNSVSLSIHSPAKEKKPKFIFKPVRQDLDYAKILRGEYSLAYMIGEENAAGEATTVAATTGMAAAGSSSSSSGGRVLGQHQGQDIVIKSGKYGAYVAWGCQNISLRPLLGISSSKAAGKYTRKETKQTKSEFDLTLQEVVAFINSSRGVAAPESECDGGGESATATTATTATTTATTGIVRMIDEHTSIRNGRFGPYIFYKTVKMSKPDFIPLKGFAQLHGNYATCDISLLKAWVAGARKK